MIDRILQWLKNIRIRAIRLNFKFNFFFNKSLRFQFITSVLVSAFIIYLLVGFFLISRLQKQAYSSSKSISDGYARETANLMTAQMNAYLNENLGLAHVVESNLNIPLETRLHLYKNSIRNIISSEPDLLAIWINIQLSAINKNWKNFHNS